MKLFYRKLGAGKPIIILHGLYGSSDNWMSIARTLSVDYEIWLLDIRNHGHSPHSNEHTYYSITIDLIEFVKEHQLNNFTLLGHSMGGKAAMYFADSYPELISNLIVIDIAPKSYLFSLELNSNTLNHKQIMQGMLALDFNGIKKREELERSLALKLNNEKIRHFLMKNVKRNSDMSFCWTLNIKALYLNIENILAEFKPLNPVKSNKFPVLFVKGSESDYINNLDTKDINSIYANLNIVEIQHAGHWLHVDQPARLCDLIFSSIGKND